jgi:hypothetical protein
MKTRFHIFVLLIALTFESCIFSDCEKLDLVNEDIEWFEPYEINQKLFFKNQFNDIDSMIVYDKSLKYTQCNKFELSEYQYQKAYLRINDLNESNLARNNKIQITFTQKEKKDLSLKNFVVYGYYFNIHDLNTELNDTIIDLKHFNKDKVKCYVFESKNSPAYGHSTSKLNKFFWNKEKGLVKYIVNDTLEYEIFEK